MIIRPNLNSSPQNLNDLPENIGERIKSIANKIQSNQASLIAKDLVRGVPSLDTTGLEFAKGNSESKHCIKLGEKTILISGIFSTSLQDLLMEKNLAVMKSPSLNIF